jgi:hypothetical protein
MLNIISTFDYVKPIKLQDNGKVQSYFNQPSRDNNCH